LNINCPKFYGKYYIHRSAIATFYASSNLSSVGEMQHKQIQAVSTWHNGPSQYNYIFVVMDESLKGMQGLKIAHIQLFLLFPYCSTTY
jgi:hypothetical protein